LQNEQHYPFISYLTFSGKNEAGDVAYFTRCPNLKTATGTFHGFVSFSWSDVKKIENLTITKTDNKKGKGNAASFLHCTNLQIATGTYPGFVSFHKSGIHSIQNLHVQNPSNEGSYADCYNCPNLKTLEGWDLTKTILIEEEKLEAEIKRRKTLKTFVQRNQPPELPFL
jgi:hypothetical protein